MDSAETIAKRYLDSLNLGEAVFEPDGNNPPDFVLRGTIGIEVRRLNQNFESGGSYSGLESDAASIYRLIIRELKKVGPALNGMGWWVSYDFRRPFDRRKLKRELPKLLKRLSALPIDTSLEITVIPNFRLEIRPAGIERTDLFSLAAYIDFDAGGWIAAEIVRNLNLCIAEKENKIEPFRHKYREWWLIFVDMISTSLNTEEWKSISQHIKKGGSDRILLINPRNPLFGFEL